MRTDEEVIVRLRHDEALVLSALLGRWFDSGPKNAPSAYLEHESERGVLEIVVGAQLDRQVVELFAADYAERLASARQAVSRRYPVNSD